MIIMFKHSIIMLNFLHVESKRLKLTKSSRRRFSSHYYGWRKTENIRRWIILIKIIYTTIFICSTISTCLHQSIDDNIQCSKRILRRIWDIWYSFLALILVLSLFIDRLKRENIISLKIINAIRILLFTTFIIFVILGHIEAYNLLWWPSSVELTRSTLLSIVLIDICPISIVIMMTINSLKKRRSWRRVHASSIISSV